MGQTESARYSAFDPLLSDADAAEMVRLCERFGSYGMYSEEPTFAGIGACGYTRRSDCIRTSMSRPSRGPLRPSPRCAGRP